MKLFFKFLLSNAKYVLFFIFLLLCIAGFYSFKLGIDASSSTLLKQNDPDLFALKELNNRYALSDQLIIAVRPKEYLLDSSTIKIISDIQTDINSIDGIAGSTSIIDIPLLQSAKGGISAFLSHVPTLKDKDIDLKLVAKEFSNSPIYTGNLVSSDLKTTAIILNLKSGLDRKAEHERIEKIRSVLSNYSSLAELYLGGASMIADDMISFIKKDLLVYAILIVILLIFCLWLFFRQIRWIFLPIFICLVSVVFASGIFGFFDWQITAVSSNFIAIQLIITVSIVIHLIVTYRDLSERHFGFGSIALTYLTLRQKLSPSFWAIFTTVVGFASLISSDIEPVRMLGIMMSLSVSVSLLISFILFGCLCALLPAIRPKRTFENSFKFTTWCAYMAINKPTIIFFISMVVLIFGIFGMLKLKVENSFIDYFDSKTEIARGMKIIDTELGGTIPIDIIVKFESAKNQDKQQEENDEFESEFDSDGTKYWFNSYRSRIAGMVHTYLLSQRFVGSVLSLDTLILAINQLNGKVDDFILAAMYEHLPDEYRSVLLKPYVNIDTNELRFSVRVKDSDPELRRDKFIKDLKNGLEKVLKDQGVKVEILGAMVLYNNVLQSLLSSQVDTLGITIGLLFLVFLVIFKSVKLSIIAVVANVIPIVGIFGVMGFFGIPLDVMSITIAAIAFGIGVDDIIHYLHGYMHQRLSGFNSNKAIENTHSSIGYAMYYTSFAIFVGFSVMMSSEFRPTIYFGFLTDLVMFAMLMSSLLLLPSLVVKFYKRY